MSSPKEPPSNADENSAFWGRAQALPDVGQSAGTPPPQPAPQPPPIPTPASSPTTKQPKSKRGLKWAASLLGLLLILIAFGGTYTALRYRQLDRIALGHVLTSTAGYEGTNYLIIGSDSREGVDANVENAGYILGEGAPTGQRADTILILRVTPNGATTLSLPRDLWLPISGAGRSQRINTAYAGGAERVIATVQDSLGIPIHHYMEIDFVNFSEIVDTLGGITIDFEYPASDKNSGLQISTAGPNQLTGSQSLAYVRSRYYTETINGQQVSQGNGDLGRVQRQQVFLASLMRAVGSTKNPWRLHRVSGAIVNAVTVDDQLGLFEGIRLARTMGSGSPESVVLPTYGYRTSGGAAVLGLADGAEAVLADFRR